MAHSNLTAPPLVPESREESTLNQTVFQHGLMLVNL